MGLFDVLAPLFAELEGFEALRPTQGQASPEGAPEAEPAPVAYPGFTGADLFAPIDGTVH